MEERGKGKEHALRKMLCSGFAGCVTECVALPIDTIKTRLMVDSSSSVSVNAIKEATRKLLGEGFGSFFKGLSPGLHRQIVFASTRIGLFEPVITNLYIL